MRSRPILGLVTALMVLAGCVAPALPVVAPAGDRTTASAPARSVASPPSRRRIVSSAPNPVRLTGPTIGDCPLFPASDPWRQDVSGLPVNPRSAAWVASIGTTAHLHPDYGSSFGIPLTLAAPGQARVPITFTDYGDQSDPGPYSIPPDARVEDGGDRHVLVVGTDCKLYELYDAQRSGAGWSAASGAVFDLRTGTRRPPGWTSADAAGLPIAPGLVRLDEVQAGVIRHALRFTAARTQAGYLAPATHLASDDPNPALPPMGARFRLKASFDISGFDAPARVVLTALKKYGMFLADNGSNWYLSGTDDPGWNDELNDDLKRVPGSAFEAVDTGKVCTDPDTQSRPPC